MSKTLTISIDRKAKQYAIFDGFQLLKNFTAYANEAEALASATSEVAKHTDEPPEVVYPQITKMTMTRSRR